jgi:hypothetical protein
MICFQGRFSCENVVEMALSVDMSFKKDTLKVTLNTEGKFS